MDVEREGVGEPIGPFTDALDTRLVVIDLDGFVVAANEAWCRAAAVEGGAPWTAGIGGDYLAAWGADGDDDLAVRIAEGVRAVMRGEVAEFRHVFPCLGREGADRWFRLRASRCGGRNSPERVVVTHDDVTELERAERAVHELTVRLLLAQDDERRFIARELHDGTAPTVVGLSLDLARLVSILAPGEARAVAEGCVRSCEQVLRELRSITFLLHPPSLRGVGLASALRTLAQGLERRSGIRVSVDVSRAEPRQLSPDAELALYRVVQEALTNVHRHSGSAAASVTLVIAGQDADVVVADEGAPPPVGAWHAGVGLAGMDQRLRALGGWLDVSVGEGGRGVVVHAHVPVASS